MKEEVIDAAKFLELYGEEIKKNRVLSGEALKQAVFIFEENRDDDEFTIKSYLSDLCSAMIKYKYFVKEQGKFEIILIRDSCTKLNLALLKSPDILKRNIYIKSCIMDASSFYKIDISKDEEIKSFTLNNLIDFNFIQSFLEKYAVNDMAKKYLRMN